MTTLIVTADEHGHAHDAWFLKKITVAMLVKMDAIVVVMSVMWLMVMAVAMMIMTMVW